MKFRTEQPLDIEVTPDDVAELFCRLDDTEQVAFFNKVGHVTEVEWHGGPHAFLMQMQAVSDSKTLTESGRNVMRVIGEYSNQEF